MQIINSILMIYRVLFCKVFKIIKFLIIKFF